MNTTPTLPLVLYPADICAALGISRWTLQRLRRSGTFPIPVLMLGDRWCVSRAAVERFLAGR